MFVKIAIIMHVMPIMAPGIVLLKNSYTGGQTAS
jgi:hypothetical protein